jgi:hypothetical protein
MTMPYDSQSPRRSWQPGVIRHDQVSEKTVIGRRTVPLPRSIALTESRSASMRMSLSQLLAIADRSGYPLSPRNHARRDRKYRRPDRRVVPTLKASGRPDTCSEHGLYYCARCDVGR